MDRMDYLLRDAHYTGVPNGVFDHLHLIEALRILKKDPSLFPKDAPLSLGLVRSGLHSGGADDRPLFHVSASVLPSYSQDLRLPPPAIPRKIAAGRKISRPEQRFPGFCSTRTPKFGLKSTRRARQSFAGTRGGIVERRKGLKKKMPRGPRKKGIRLRAVGKKKSSNFPDLRCASENIRFTENGNPLSAMCLRTAASTRWWRNGLRTTRDNPQQGGS